MKNALIAFLCSMLASGAYAGAPELWKTPINRAGEFVKAFRMGPFAGLHCGDLGTPTGAKINKGCSFFLPGVQSIFLFAFDSDNDNLVDLLELRCVDAGCEGSAFRDLSKRLVRYIEGDASDGALFETLLLRRQVLAPSAMIMALTADTGEVNAISILKPR
jgi:hypothetical protein